MCIKPGEIRIQLYVQKRLGMGIELGYVMSKPVKYIVGTLNKYDILPEGVTYFIGRRTKMQISLCISSV